MHTALRELVPAVQIGDDPAGLHELLLLPSGVEESSVLAAAASRGVGLEGLSWHRYAAGPGALLAGYAHLGEASLWEAIRRLADAVASVA
jgi:GntR family transcriptional regulator/MocR family aminotransferase